MKNNIIDDITQAIYGLQHEGGWPNFALPKFVVEKPNDKTHGDFACNIALQLAPVLKKSPLEIAEEIREHLNAGQYDEVQIAPPGFLNFFSANVQFAQAVQEILDKKEKYGSSNQGAQAKVLLEFISANPTGPLTLPNGRGGYLGDVLSNVYQDQGFDVSREYYINDRGHQIDMLGESVMRRYLQSQGINVAYDEELYQGAYIKELAQKIELEDYKLSNPEKMEWIKKRVKELALNLMLTEIKRVVTHKMEIHYDSWFSEKSMYDLNLPKMILAKLKEKSAIYEKDGAVWLKTTKHGDDKDRVLIKSSGEGAYMQGDVALFYHRAFERKFQKIILILGADHHGYEKRLKAIPPLLQSDTRFDIIFTQMVTLMKGKEEMRMSKRKGDFVTIEELIDEVGNDVTRFFFLMYSSDRQMTFDLSLACEKSEKNPVFYVQYAHARICSMLKNAEKEGVPALEKIVISHAAERSLARELMRLPEILEEVVRTYEAHHLTTYAQDLARAFHHFYDKCRVIDNDQVLASRYQLVKATQIVLAKTLKILGVSAPEKM
ncbi:MAG: arginine--tRNA ligase [Candidatus Kerfeldbacteria bacterium RIFOXYA2_FULL_38_24]|uniref:Arginine--tRNA ligase n=1 Tax=Candidatus Kerfeldbacteria bacterium RIFOXYB2_FULL_38_14 TaxID=1798547 RepID=A0A1G2BDJ4_9BACT|nr:MAG: arginine--tRNA ligase [Candidatus Kerfeldbacteria bacterium RIFOXYA2_FULL_38_24]OGY86340.1 MAG: arginine--tRNA ligase [Candidatus Kerfeldbacteria bacterium RIFOXYB2_FULL_38_14]OGY88431.1 MAG: arginine--tRNA ligase [Candidatus Kerfeldbacteria bacterium RIFOXYC2_FULL_38_9]